MPAKTRQDKTRQGKTGVFLRMKDGNGDGTLLLGIQASQHLPVGYSRIQLPVSSLNGDDF